VHRDSDLAPRIGARAFTHGPHIYFAPGEYRPESPDGLATLGHELAHVAQPGGASTASPVRRKIGFEFETNHVFIKRANGGPQPPAAAYAAGAGATAWAHPQATWLRKGQTVLKRPDIEVQADEWHGWADLEVVTAPFEENTNGRNRLRNAMTSLNGLITAYANLGAAPAGDFVSARALAGQGFQVKMSDAIFSGPWRAAGTAPQVTMGIRLQNVANIVADLHRDRNENALDRAARNPGRLRMRVADPVVATRPRKLAAGSEAATLATAARRARDTHTNYQAANNAAPAGAQPALEGLLTIVFTYIEGMAHKSAFLKSFTPLMAKTDLATMWTTLPPAVKTYYRTANPAGVTNFEALVAMRYAARMDQPLFSGLPANAPFDEDDQPLGQPQWYQGLTLRSWLRGIASQRRVLGVFSRRGVDQLTNKNFPGRPANKTLLGYGALGSRMDTHAATQDKLPVFELRSATRLINYAQARQWSLDMFDYIRSLNNNPGGGYAHMPARVGFGI
jgi:hypothetical protein